MGTERKQRGQTDVQLDSTPFRPEGTLIVIGGNEAKEGHRPILELIAKRARAGQAHGRHDRERRARRTMGELSKNI